MIVVVSDPGNGLPILLACVGAGVFGFWLVATLLGALPVREPRERPLSAEERARRQDEWVARTRAAGEARVRQRERRQARP